MEDGSSISSMNNESIGNVTVFSRRKKGEGGGGVVGIVENTNPDVGKDMSTWNESLSQQGIFQGEKDRGTEEWKEGG